MKDTALNAGGYTSGQMELLITPSREIETIKSFNFKAESYWVIRNKPIGTMLIDFLELEIKCQEAFEVFLYKWGISGLLKHSETALKHYNIQTPEAVDKHNDFLMGEANEEKEYLPDKDLITQIHKECRNKLSKAQIVLNEAVYIILDANGPKWTKGLNPKQRFYVYRETKKDEIRKLELNHAQNLTVFFDALIGDNNVKTGDVLISTQGLFNQEMNIAHEIKDIEVSMREIYRSGDLVAICYAELKEMVASDVIVKRCKHCGKFFIPLKKADEKYCDRPIKTSSNGTMKTCKEIGPAENYSKKIKEDPIRALYQKAYKARHARFRAKVRAKPKNEPKLREEFYFWKADVEKAMEKVKQGIMNLEDFQDLLKRRDNNGR